MGIRGQIFINFILRPIGIGRPILKNIQVPKNFLERLDVFVKTVLNSKISSNVFNILRTILQVSS